MYSFKKSAIFDYKYIKFNLQKSILSKYFDEKYCNFTFMHMYLYKDNITIIQDDSENYLGFIWTSRFNLGINIEALYIEESVDLSTLQFCITSSVFKNKNVFFCTENDLSIFNKLELLGFVETKNIIDMKIDDFGNFHIPEIKIPKEVTIKPFKFREDDAIRCTLQNDIFQDINRIPLTIQDIISEQKSIYYLNNGGFFILFEDTYIGYGQIINENYDYSIVNLGIIDEFKGKGYGKILTTYLMRHCQMNYDDINTLKLKVDKNNSVARNLYGSLGFEEFDSQVIWKLRD